MLDLWLNRYAKR